LEKCEKKICKFQQKNGKERKKAKKRNWSKSKGAAALEQKGDTDGSFQNPTAQGRKVLQCKAGKICEKKELTSKKIERKKKLSMRKQ